MKIKLLISLVILVIILSFLTIFLYERKSSPAKNVDKVSTINENQLDKYTFKNLSQHKPIPGKLSITDLVSNNDNFNSFLFEFTFSPDLNDKNQKMTTGMINIPKSGKINGIVVMFRGYINQKTYKTGDGTKNASYFFAKNGFITIAPDFLGYAKSDKEADNIFESRFQTYVTAVSLIYSCESLNNGGIFTFSDSTSNIINKEGIKNLPIFIWGHSNGGQIALTTLEITKKDYPTSLWAPVSKPFPYSILYYTDESDDRGKLIRRELANFEKSYNVDDYSLDLFLDQISAPILLHQGTNDDAVPKNWSDDLYTRLSSLGKDIKYIVHRGADHNIVSEWGTAVNEDLAFYLDHLK